MAVHFFHLVSMFSSKQSPYMHPSAELYIPVSDVHPSLARQITLFSLLRGIKNLEKQKKKQKGRTYVPVSGIGSVLLFFLFFLVFPGKTKKTKRQNLCPSIWHRVGTFVFFVFFVFFGFSR